MPVVVIGPYRSGKSFLLNQLLGVGCGERLRFQQTHMHAAPRIATPTTHCSGQTHFPRMKRPVATNELSVMQTTDSRWGTRATRRQRGSGCGASRGRWKLMGVRPR